MKKSDFTIVVPLTIAPAIQAAQEQLDVTQQPVETILLEKGLHAIMTGKCTLADHPEFGGEKGYTFTVPTKSKDVRNCTPAAAHRLNTTAEKALFLALVRGLKEVTGHEYARPEPKQSEFPQIAEASASTEPLRDLFVGNPVIEGVTIVPRTPTFFHRISCSCGQDVDVPHGVWKVLRAKPSRPVCSACAPQSEHSAETEAAA